jgi:hypothetical protein
MPGMTEFLLGSETGLASFNRALPATANRLRLAEGAAGVYAANAESDQ